MQRNKQQISRVWRDTSTLAAGVFARVYFVLCDDKECDPIIQTRGEIIDFGEKASRSSSVKCQISEVDCREIIVRDKKRSCRIKPRDPKFHLPNAAIA